MKIVHIIPAAWPTIHYGGASLVAHYQCRGLVRRGHKVALISSDALTSDSRRQSNSVPDGGYPVLVVPNLSNILAYQMKIFLPVDVDGRLDSSIRSADIVHIHDYRTILAVLGCRSCLRHGVPFVLQPHGSVTTRYGKAPLKIAFDWFFGKYMLAQAHRLIALTQGEADNLQQNGVPAEKVAILPNGVDVPVQDMVVARSVHRAKLGIRDEEFILLYLGRIHPSKRLDLLLKALSLLLNRGIRVRGWIVGPNDGDRGVNSLAKHLGLNGIVHVVPPVRESMKWQFLAAADLLVIPNFEGFPLVILEALAVGTPVVACGTLDAPWEDDLVFVDRNPQALANAIEASAKYRRRLDDQRIYKIQSDYAWTEVASRLESIYRDIV